MIPRHIRTVGLAVGLGLPLFIGVHAQPRAVGLPDRLTDQQFWQLSTEMSEPNGFFRSDNLVSNEHTFQFVLPSLAKQVRPGGVYLGVAPDQNFTYILASAPRMAFIVDIRRGNLLEHLLYKAIIELSPDRATFLSRLFSKPKPQGIRPNVSAAGLFAAYESVASREDAYRQNLQAVKDQLGRRHGFRLSPDDIATLEDIYFSFFWEGPGLRYTMSTGLGPGGVRPGFPTYQDLMTGGDAAGVPKGYLASEPQFQALKTLQERNLIVPVVGNFAGPKALRAVGRYARDRGAKISAFYVSNVEQYLFQDGLFEAFAQNVATLPLDTSSTFIRSVSSRFGYEGKEPLGPDGRATALYPMLAFTEDFRAGRLSSYFDVNRRSR
ncbi:MAG: hypothetical protein ABI634_13905 [Acidobacteriota bacterium]